jgi:putative mycofactocin binding protein MftB
MNLDAHYALSRDAAVRPERFGGLVYRYDNRRLYFLYSRDLVDFVCSIDGACPLGAALDAFLATHALPANAREVFVNALVQLEQLKVLEEAHNAEVYHRA